MRGDGGFDKVVAKNLRQEEARFSTSGVGKTRFTVVHRKTIQQLVSNTRINSVFQVLTTVNLGLPSPVFWGRNQNNLLMD